MCKTLWSCQEPVFGSFQCTSTLTWWNNHYSLQKILYTFLHVSKVHLIIFAILRGPYVALWLNFNCNWKLLEFETPPNKVIYRWRIVILHSIKCPILIELACHPNIVHITIQKLEQQHATPWVKVKMYEILGRMVWYVFLYLPIQFTQSLTQHEPYR